jgi:hypothetical protein
MRAGLADAVPVDGEAIYRESVLGAGQSAIEVFANRPARRSRPVANRTVLARWRPNACRIDIPTAPRSGGFVPDMIRAQQSAAFA